MDKNKLHIGCSSYATSSWRPLFYPQKLPKRLWFDYYCQHFKTYELNSTFYRFPTVESLLSWYGKTPDDFIFSIKVPKIITHIKRLKDCKEEIEEFYSVAEKGLKNKLACILWQLPPSFTFSPERLELVIHAMKPGFKNVVEFRNESWWREDVMNELSKNNITFCNVNYPGLPAEIRQNTEIGYVRMHGNPELFHSEYSEKDIEALYRDINNQGFKEAYVYFNNTASTAGIINALQFAKIHNRIH